MCSARLRHLAAALGIVALGLAVRAWRGTLPPAVADVAGDALWAAMLFCGVDVLAPRASIARRAAAALGAAWTIEAGQLLRWPWLVALRATPLGHLVLGADFDARDLGAYALGVAGAACVAAVASRVAARAVAREVQRAA